VPAQAHHRRGLGRPGARLAVRIRAHGGSPSPGGSAPTWGGRGSRSGIAAAPTAGTRYSPSRTTSEPSTAAAWQPCAPGHRRSGPAAIRRGRARSRTAARPARARTHPTRAATRAARRTGSRARGEREPRRATQARVTGPFGSEFFTGNAPRLAVGTGSRSSRGRSCRRRRTGGRTRGWGSCPGWRRSRRGRRSGRRVPARLGGPAGAALLGVAEEQVVGPRLLSEVAVAVGDVAGRPSPPRPSGGGPPPGRPSPCGTGPGRRSGPPRGGRPCWGSWPGAGWCGG
jgi:hypothetical protein